MKIYAVYDTKYSEQCIGIFNSTQEIADFFGMSRNTVCSGMSRKQKIKCRYDIVKMNIDDRSDENVKNQR